MVLSHSQKYKNTRLAVAVSGGRDSMALTHMLRDAGAKLHALTVDHNLRAESTDEAAQVERWMQEWNIPHTVLTWEESKPETGLMDAARNARYRLMADFCKENDLEKLALGHHGDDQIETFLHRLTKGSGLDGLTVMQEEISLYNITLVRPLLFMSREEITAYCTEHGIPYVDDPSNEKDRYTRVRFRKFLQSEGLDTHAMNRTIMRLSRAANTLEYDSHNLFNTLVVQETPLSLDITGFQKAQEEHQVRILEKALQKVSGNFHPTRLSKIEEALPSLIKMQNGQAFTIGGCLIECKGGHLVLSLEKRKR